MNAVRLTAVRIALLLFCRFDGAFAGTEARPGISGPCPIAEKAQGMSTG
jgi:hypothetical protein